MKVLRYLIFLIFNLGYKDGNYKENDMPHIGAASVVMGYELCILIVGVFFLDRYIDFTPISVILKPLENIVYGWGILMCALMYPINHYYFVKKKHLDQIYDEFKNARINTKKNRVIGYTCLIFYWPIMIGVIGHLKYWFP